MNPDARQQEEYEKRRLFGHVNAGDVITIETWRLHLGKKVDLIRQHGTTPIDVKVKKVTKGAGHTWIDLVHLDGTPVHRKVIF